ncbi:MFS transporter [Mycetocola zhadangensis]|uniref:MFS transporter n=1 Tax=Mycetocola zhadangensis TaxID=1164595 RepID=A0A3L7J5I3_9MICO|nr:MFS transporter [Mycetocola zhadangensis]RLQ85770.1 MFS transporter [Mycetocola zhadangensis]GGE85663.1 MFS transporter [Mycetocola zhadangensis]
MTTDKSTAEFSFRSVAVVVFLPTLLFSIGEGALIPLIPVAATNLGASLAIAGVISGMVMIGELVGDIPSGWLVSKIGERVAMIGASAISVLAVLGAVLAPNVWVLAAAIFVLGLSTAVFALARHAFMASYVPIQYRARALSTLGGVFRAGLFIGPLIAAPVIHLTGGAQGAFWIMVVSCLAAVLILIFLPDPESVFSRASHPQAAHSTHAAGTQSPGARSNGLFHTIWNSRGVLVRMGSGAALISAMRATRTIILPLWAVSLGVSEVNTALIIGIAGGVDFALFYASGQIMDRFGRMFSAIPSLIGLGLGMLLLAFTHDSPNAVGWFIAAAGLLAVANGIGSGILMTLGADLAPVGSPAPFLGAWRFTGDLGAAGAPLLVGGLTAVLSVSFAAGLIGVVGILGAIHLARIMPRYLQPRPGRRLP